MRDRRITRPPLALRSGADQLEQWLIKNRLTQAEGADRVGISRVKFNQYLNHVGRPSLETAIRIEDVTLIPVRSWLVEDRPAGGESRRPAAPAAGEAVLPQVNITRTPWNDPA